MHPRLQLGSADDLGHVQQQPANRSDARLRHDLQRDGPQRADHPDHGRPHGTLPQWTGDSRGRWEGDTLVVETLNFRRETSLQGSTAKTTVVERLTRLDAKTIDYRFTISDPDAYTKPWTAVMPLRVIDGLLFEYACHEANYGMEGVLRGARFREREAAKK